MALKPACLLFLWDLTLLIHCVTSLCNVTCSTDYIVSLNCSCSGTVPTYPVLLQVSCSNGDEEVNGSCEVQLPQSWCVMNLEYLEDVASIGTMCTATASHQGDQVVTQASGSSTWALSDVVKPQPPFDVQVTNSDGSYNITWANHHQKDCLLYRVRIRESKDLTQDPVHSLLMETTYMRLHQDKLQPHVAYTVDVQAKMCPENVYRGPWSEWGASVEWRTTGTSGEVEGIYRYWCFVLLPISLALCLLLLHYLKKTFWLKKLRVLTFIPGPKVFFEPLYQDYGGNFKEWVRPLFSEYDYPRINSHAQLMSEKQDRVLQWSKETKTHREDDEATGGGRSLHMLWPPGNGLPHFPGEGGSQGTGHSVGLLSIHTVTLSGEEFEVEEVMSRSSVSTLRSYQDGQSFGSFEGDNSGHAGYDLETPRLDRKNCGMSPQHENQAADGLSADGINFRPRAQFFDEPERLSLDSFASNEQSEDGYPRVDLDTVDSGFVECGSPGVSDSDAGEQAYADLFHEHKNSNSNYVKQWMVCNAIQEDPGSPDSELRETH
uniref:Fibronectin type-III domain-containing protein n=1 Tax=Scophthalmus maximus TaxID=52904 RepID=A0A8D3DPB2_SCOMX